MSNQHNESTRGVNFRFSQSSDPHSSRPKNKNLENNGSRPRNFPMAANNFQSRSKKRRKNAFVPPTHFLLGGNIHDPLNLKSIKTNDPQNSTDFPESLSVPSCSKEKVDVIIPPNMKDPLNLAHSHSLNDSDLLPITTLHPKHNKRLRTSSESDLRDHVSKSNKGLTQIVKDDSFINRDCLPNQITIDSEVVSPVANSSFFYNKKDNYKKSFDREKAPSTSSTNSKQTERFQYGNYNRYYGYRNIEKEVDPRIKLFQKQFFAGKDVLDIGCNVGHVTLTVARDFSPKKIVGIDIDPYLIKAAKRNIQHYVTNKLEKTECSPILYGQTDFNPEIEGFPNNIMFIHTNYVPESDELIQYQQPEYDSIICLSLTKWIHLNWGDAGVKRLFRRIFAHLRPGGRLILEPQPWSSYRKKSKITPKTLENFRSIRFKPEHFHEYLLKDVGFKSCELLGTPQHEVKGFQRPIYLYTKKDIISVQ